MKRPLPAVGDVFQRNRATVDQGWNRLGDMLGLLTSGHLHGQPPTPFSLSFLHQQACPPLTTSSPFMHLSIVFPGVVPRWKALLPCVQVPPAPRSHWRVLGLHAFGGHQYWGWTAWGWLLLICSGIATHYPTGSFSLASFAAEHRFAHYPAGWFPLACSAVRYRFAYYPTGWFLSPAWPQGVASSTTPLGGFLSPAWPHACRPVDISACLSAFSCCLHVLYSPLDISARLACFLPLLAFSPAVYLFSSRVSLPLLPP